MGKASCLQDRRGLAIDSVQLGEPGIGVGLQDAGPGRKVASWAIAAPVGRIVEDDRGRITASEGPVVAHVIPQSAGNGLALGHDRHGGVVAVQPLGGQRVGLDQLVDRHERQTGGTDLVGERGHAEWHAFMREALGLAVERLMLPVLVEQQHGEEARAGPSTRGDMERRRWLRDLLAVPAGELLAYRLDDLPRARDHLECLGQILAKPGQPVAAARRARARRADDDTFAWEVIGKRLPDRLLALECGNGCRLRRGGLGSQLVLGRVGFEILKLELELCEQPLGAFGASAILLASQLGVLQLEMRDYRFGGARQSAGVGQLGLDGCGVLLGFIGF